MRTQTGLCLLLVLWASAAASSDQLLEGSGGGCDCEDMAQQISQLESSVSARLQSSAHETTKHSHQISRLEELAQHDRQTAGRVSARVNKLAVQLERLQKRLERQMQQLTSRLHGRQRGTAGRARRKRSCDPDSPDYNPHPFLNTYCRRPRHRALPPG